MNIQASLWRSIAVFRFASLAYAAVLLVVDRPDYAHPASAWGVLAGMAVWTVVTTVAYAAPDRRTRPLLAADLVVTPRHCCPPVRCNIPAAWQRRPCR